MELTIQATKRQQYGRHNEKLRKAGTLPAVLYGPKKETVALQISTKDFDKIYRKAGESTLVNLAIEGSKEVKKVLIHEVAKHYAKDEAIHVDFYEVDLTKKIHAKIAVHFIGAAPVVKESGGILVKNLTEVEVEAMPADLPHAIEVDLGKIKTFDDAIRISDLVMGDNVRVLGNPEDVIVKAQPPRSEAELSGLNTPTAEAEKAAVEAVAAEPAKEGEAATEGDAKKAEPKEEKTKVEKKDKKE